MHNKKKGKLPVVQQVLCSIDVQCWILNAKLQYLKHFSLHLSFCSLWYVSRKALSLKHPRLLKLQDKIRTRLLLPNETCLAQLTRFIPGGENVCTGRQKQKWERPGDLGQVTSLLWFSLLLFSLLPLVCLVQLKRSEAGVLFALSAYLANKVPTSLGHNSNN